jgi:hypothetical protein
MRRCTTTISSKDTGGFSSCETKHHGHSIYCSSRKRPNELFDVILVMYLESHMSSVRNQNLTMSRVEVGSERKQGKTSSCSQAPPSQKSLGCSAWVCERQCCDSNHQGKRAPLCAGFEYPWEHTGHDVRGEIGKIVSVRTKAAHQCRGGILSDRR